MENQSFKPQNPILRQLASLKVLSRLMGHELHAQGATKTVTFSREEMNEIQTAIDLYIEDVTRRYSQAPAAGGVANVETPLVATRN